MPNLEDRIEQLAADVAHKVGLMIAAPITDMVDELVRERLSAIVEQIGGSSSAKSKAPPPRRVVTPKKPSKPPKVAANYGPKCGKCGGTGHNARTCGKAKATAGDDDEDEGEPAPRIAALIERSSIGQGLKNIRENGIDAELADLERRPRRDDKPPPPRQPRKLDTTTVAIAAPPSCPHGGGSPASCSQCVLAGVKVTRVTIAGGNVVVDGAAVRSTREMPSQGYSRNTKKKTAA